MTGWVVTVVASNAVCNPLLQNAMCARRPRAALAVFPISSYPFSIDERSALGACRSLHSTLMQRHWPPFAWVCFAMCVGVMGTALASPLYPLYQAHWGLQPSHITGIYVAGLQLPLRLVQRVQRTGQGRAHDPHAHRKTNPGKRGPMALHKKWGPAKAPVKCEAALLT